MTATNWAVSGTGAVTSNGRGSTAVFDALCAARSGLGGLRGFDATRFRAQHAYQVDDGPHCGAAVVGHATTMLIDAIAEALTDAGLPDRLGEVPVLIGTGLRELRTVELWSRDRADLTESQLDFGSALRDRFGAGDTHTFSNACSASLYALALGSDLLELGEADTVVVAGVDTITESMFGLLDRVHPKPVDSVRPFDRDRRGVLMGDGAAAIVLSRDAAPGLARLRSVAINCDAYHPTAPDAASIVASIHDAHQRAELAAGGVDLLLAHGTGTLLNDETEAVALGKVFAGLEGPLVTAVKSMTGHTSGGSGLLSLVVAVHCLRTGRIPPTLGLDNPVPEAAGLRFVREAVTGAELSTAQVEAFGFGGVNAVAVIEKEPST